MKVYILTAFFFIVGISSGVFASLMISDGEKLFALEYFNKYLPLNTANEALHSEVFFYSLTNNLTLLLLIFVVGIFAWTHFLAYSAMIYKGLVLGFSVAFILEGLHLKGALLILLSVVPQNLFFITTLFVAVTLANQKRYEHSPSTYIRNFLILTIPLLVGSLLEAYLAPVLTQLVI